MSRLAVRKQLLIAESELNRAQLAEEWAAMTTGVRTFIGRAKFLSSIASAAALLVTGFAALQRAKSMPAGEKSPWWQTLLKGAGAISKVWLAFRAQGHDPENQSPESRA